jgi:hypothetical protein
MPADNVRDQLRELHEAYIWKVNAAVGEGREDLVRRLAEEYTTEAMQLMAQEQHPPCHQPDCELCGLPREVLSGPPARRGWLRRHGRRP